MCFGCGGEADKDLNGMCIACYKKWKIESPDGWLGASKLLLAKLRESHRNGGIHLR